MVDRKQMYAILLGLCGLTFGTACASRPAPFARDGDKIRSDRPAPFNPAKTYPEWAYDAPSYTRPVDEPQAEQKSRVKDPEHFFTSKPVIMVHQPAGYNAEEIPRVAVWYTRDNGNHWKKAGYFGRSSTYFPLPVKKEGDYGIRFLGPGQESATATPPDPVCVHHVDMTPPKVKLSIEPEQAWYTLGQRVTVNWTATDPHLEAMPARVSVLPDWASNQAQPIEIAREQPEAGSIEYTVPANLMGDGFRIRVDAIDRAGNIGLAYSQTLQIEPDRMDGGVAKPPIQTIRHDDAGLNTSDTQVQANASPPPVEVGSTQTVSPAANTTVGAGEMLPLEEIPVTGSATPVKESVPEPPSKPIQDATPAMTDVRVQSAPAKAPTASPAASSIETLPLLPLHEAPIGSTSVHTQRIEPRAAEPDPQDDQTIVRDTPSDAPVPADMPSNEPVPVEEDTLIRPVMVAEERSGAQSQASQQQDVECDSVEQDLAPAETKEDDETAPMNDEAPDDEANAGGLSGWQTVSTPEVVQSTVPAGGSSFGETLSNGLRAAEAAVEKLLAGVKGSNGVTAAELLRGADVMVGGGLAAPMPATVFSLNRTPSTQTPHAWRTLASRATRRSGEVWSLPRPVLNFELPRLFARETQRGPRQRGEISAENSSARGSRIQAVAVSSDPE